MAELPEFKLSPKLMESIDEIAAEMEAERQEKIRLALKGFAYILGILFICLLAVGVAIAFTVYLVRIALGY